MSVHIGLLGDGGLLYRNNIMANQEYTDLILSSAHQIKTSLSKLKWAAQLLLDPSSDPLTDKQRDVMKQTLASTEDALSLVEDLLHTLRLEEGGMQVNPVIIDLNILLSDVIERFRHQAEALSIELSFSLNPSVSPVRTDKEKLAVVIGDIIHNALKYTPPKGHVNVQLDKDGDAVKITISDTGIGIPVEEQGKVFSKFFRASNVDTKFPGTGLGLFLARRIMTMLGGKIEFVSQGGSTIFSIYVPAVK